MGGAQNPPTLVGGEASSRLKWPLEGVPTLGSGGISNFKWDFVLISRNWYQNRQESAPIVSVCMAERIYRVKLVSFS